MSENSNTATTWVALLLVDGVGLAESWTNFSSLEAAQEAAKDMLIERSKVNAFGMRIYEGSHTVDIIEETRRVVQTLEQEEVTVATDEDEISIDLVAHQPDGEVYVILSEPIRDENYTLVEYEVHAMAGPLDTAEQEYLRAHPADWDDDPVADLYQVGKDLINPQCWRFVEEISPSSIDYR